MNGRYSDMNDKLNLALGGKKAAFALRSGG